jgi:hypothetical protein
MHKIQTNILFTPAQDYSRITDIDSMNQKIGSPVVHDADAKP